MDWNWISYEDLHRDGARFAAALPADIGGIVGVPRSGLLTACIVGLHRHLPVADVETFCRTGEFYRPSQRLRETPPAKRPRVLLLDDSIFSGRTMGAAVAKIRASRPETPLVRAAVYAAPGSQRHIDLFHRVVAMPRVFAWNWLASAHLGEFLSDIDGVLCYDPGVFDNDGPQYQDALRHARPFYLPRQPVGGLITCRLARWRNITRDWLARHGVRYGKLTMYPAATADERRARGGYGQWKGEHFRRSQFTLCFESSRHQAPAIAATSGKPVVCLENGKLYK